MSENSQPNDKAPVDAAGDGSVPTAPAPEQAATTKESTSQVAERPQRSVLREITESSTLVVILSVFAAMLVGAILIIIADKDSMDSLKYLFARPSDFFSSAWGAISGAYQAMFEGAIFNGRGSSFADKIRPVTNTMTMATPLIFAGLGLGVGFRAGLFNIGAQGQLILGATLGGYVGFAWNLPVGLHLALAVIAAALGGAIWGFIPGLLKAKTGAHEVITTIMLNYVAVNLLAYLLSLTAFQRPGSSNPVSPRIHSSAEYPLLFGSDFRLHWGFILALVAAFGVWWLMERTKLGFTFRAAGANPNAARTAGMSVKAAYIWVFVVAGSLAGLAGSAQVLGTQKTLEGSIAGSIGFDAITVALLGRSRPLGIVMAGLLFGGLKAAGPSLQVNADLPVDIVMVLQSLIVLFIAAPPLVRAMFRLPAPAQEKVVPA